MKKGEQMKTVISLGIYFVLILTISLPVFGASMRDLLYQGTTSKDMALFHGDQHLKKGLTCNDCHNKDIFPVKKFGAAKITMKSIAQGKHCGACHNGVRAFAVTGKCNLCHPNKTADMVVYD